MNDPKNESGVHLLDQQDEFEFIETPTDIVRLASEEYERMRELELLTVGHNPAQEALSRIGHLKVGEA